MKTVLILLAIIFGAGVLIALLARWRINPDLGWISFDKVSKEGETPVSYMKDETTSGMMINFDVPGMFVQEVKVEGVKYHRLSIPDHATLLDVGKPELPLLGQTVEVPYGVHFDIEIVKSKSISLHGYNVYPAQEQEIRPGEFDGKILPLKEKPFVKDTAVYLANANYPAELATIEAEDVGIIRGHRLVFLKVNPIQYKPLTRRMTAFSNIEVRLKYDRPAQVQRIDERIKSPDFEEMLKSAVLNYKAPERMIQGLGQGSPDWGEGCEYLIITHSRFYDKNNPENPVVRLSNWKRRKGIKTKVVDVDDIANVADDKKPIKRQQAADKIQNFIKTAYETWNPAPTYVLLVGDAGDDNGKDLIPTNYKTPHFEKEFHREAKIPTDLYYATVDGDDYFPDIYIGRLPVDTIDQARVVIDKILDYERKPPSNNPGFYKNLALVSTFEDPTDPKLNKVSDGQEDQSFDFIEVLEDVRKFLKNKGYNPQRIYHTSSTYKDGPQKYENGTQLPDDLKKPQFSWNGNAKQITDSIEKGAFLVEFLTHGWRAGIAAPRFRESDAKAVENGALTPIIFAHSCAVAWFDNETDIEEDQLRPENQKQWRTDNKTESFSEDFLRLDKLRHDKDGSNKGGGVAVIGATRSSYFHSYMTLGAFEALWPEFKPNPPISRAQGATGDLPNVMMGPLVRMGQILTFSKVYMANYIKPKQKELVEKRKIDFEVMHLLGDPEMPVWTKEPSTLKVQYPKGIGSKGQQDFVVKVTDRTNNKPVQSAVVVLTQGDRIIGSKQTDFGGIVRFTLESPKHGKLDITVTARNYRPFENEIKVTQGGAVLNLLTQDGAVNMPVKISGNSFKDNEKVTIFFDEKSMGSLSQTGDITFLVPPSPLGLVNILAHEESSGLYAVDVFQVRSEKPVDFYTYDQRYDKTWKLHKGDNPTWNNPAIQLYEGNKPVESNNLNTGGTYTIKANIYNDSPYPAENVKVTFKWAPFGVGQAIWNYIDTVSLDVPAKKGETEGEKEAELQKWTPPRTGHICLIAQIYHVEDKKTKENLGNVGQENCHIGPSSSPARVRFVVHNPTDKAAAVYLELRQLIKPDQPEEELLWPTKIEHPDPQIIFPGRSMEAWAIVEPPANVPKGQQAEFALTAFIDRQVIGGVNFIITKR